MSSSDTSSSDDEIISTSNSSICSFGAARSGEANKNSNKYGTNLLVKIKDLCENEELTDVTLVAGVDGKRISAHRIVLAASSEYFRAMFTGSFLEAGENDVTLEGVEGNILESIVKFCYSGFIDLKEGNVQAIFNAANQFQLDIIVDYCANFFKRQLNANNCLGYASFAEQHNCDGLLAAANKYICNHYMEVCQRDEFLNLSSEQLGKLLVKDDIHVTSEESVFESLQSWLKHDEGNRQKYIPELLSSIRLRLIEPSYLAEFVRPICTNYESQKLLIEAFMWHSLPEKQSEEQVNGIKRRKLTEPLPIYLVDQILLAMQICWPSLDLLRSHSTSSYHLLGEKYVDWISIGLNTKIFFAGKNHQNRDMIVYYDFDKPSRREKLQRKDFYVQIYENNIYLVGGTDRGHSTNKVSCCTYVFPNGRDVPAMRQRREELAVALTGGLMYAIGGRCRTEEGQDMYLNSMECYNANGWSERRRMKFRRARFATGVYNEFIYVFGGFNGGGLVNAIERYDTVNDIWTTMSTRTDGRQNLGCLLFNNKFFLMGGFKTNGSEKIKVNYYEIYDPIFNTLSKKIVMEHPSPKVHAAVTL